MIFNKIGKLTFWKPLVVLAKIPENFMYLSRFFIKLWIFYKAMNFYSWNFVGWDILNGSPCTMFWDSLKKIREIFEKIQIKFLLLETGRNFDILPEIVIFFLKFAK